MILCVSIAKMVERHLREISVIGSNLYLAFINNINCTI